MDLASYAKTSLQTRDLSMVVKNAVRYRDLRPLKPINLPIQEMVRDDYFSICMAAGVGFVDLFLFLQDAGLKTEMLGKDKICILVTALMGDSVEVIQVLRECGMTEVDALLARGEIFWYDCVVNEATRSYLDAWIDETSASITFLETLTDEKEMLFILDRYAPIGRSMVIYLLIIRSTQNIQEVDRYLHQFLSYNDWALLRDIISKLLMEHDQRLINSLCEEVNITVPLALFYPVDTDSTDTD